MQIKHLLSIIIIIITLFLAINSSHAISLIQNIGKYNLGNHLEYIQDIDKKWTIYNILGQELSNRFIRSTEDVPNFGFQHSAFWFRFKISSNELNQFNNIWFLSCKFLAWHNN